MPFKIWIEVAGKFQGIDDRLSDLGKTMTLIVGIHEAHVKGSVVGNENRSLTESLKLLQDLHQGLAPRTCSLVIPVNWVVKADRGWPGSINSSNSSMTLPLYILEAATWIKSL